MYREKFFRLLEKDEKGAIIEHYTRMVRLRLKFKGVVTPETEADKVWIPECHTVARAYERVYGLPYVDGEFTFISNRKEKGISKKPFYEVSAYAHSWNVVEHNGEPLAILDMFPDIGAPVMPVLLPYPSPQYRVREDPDFKKKILQPLQQDPHLERDVELVASEFRRLEPINE